MQKIIGYIDNASSHRSYFHLVFTTEYLYACEISNPTETRRAFMGEMKANNTGSALIESEFVPVVGLYHYHNTLQRSVMDFLASNTAKGADIEANLDNYISNNPNRVRSFDYDQIESAEFKQGTDFKLPHLIIKTGEETLKFHLVHDNYHHAGKLQQDTYDRYRNTLTEALGPKLSEGE